MMNDDYSNAKKRQVFVLGPDVFVTSGSETLNHFGTEENDNLIVIPRNYIPHLKSIREAGRYGSMGAAEAIEYLDGLLRKISSNTRFNEEGADHSTYSYSQVYSLSENLGVQFVDFPGRQSLDDVIDETLDFARIKHGEEPELVTQDEDQRSRQLVKNNKVNVPEFLSEGNRNYSRSILTLDEGISEIALPILYSSKDHSMPVEELRNIVFGNRKVHPSQDFIPRQFFCFEAGDSQVYARTVGDVKRTSEGFIMGIDNPKVRLLSDNEHDFDKYSVLGIKPKDMNQYLAMHDILLNPDVTLAFIVGSQGSGKSLVIYATAVSQMLGRKEKKLDNLKRGSLKYRDANRLDLDELIIIKPTNPMGGSDRDPGILPGGIWPKIYHTYSSFIDTHTSIPDLKIVPFEEMLLHPRFATEFGDQRFINNINGMSLPDKPLIRAIHCAHLRGRTFPNAIYWIDEPQNFNPYEVRTIIERAGRNTKIILSGDNMQIDNKYCKKPYGIDGLTSALSHYITEPFAGFMFLEGNYRHQASLSSLSWRVSN
ncbi:MAG: PhoH family protein [Candidatus Woesearchaeota archaeon]